MAGHPDNSGTYHYHARVSDNCGYNNISGTHSPIFAMMDGIIWFI